VRFLITTPLRVFVFDAESGAITDILIGSHTGYYGLTWREDAFLLGRGSSVVAVGAGGLASHTPTRMDQTHGIEWVEDRLVVADTGDDRISVYDRGGMVLDDFKLGEDVDLIGDVPAGHHVNTVHRHGDRVWAVAHNWSKPSEVWEFTWPHLELVRVHATRAGWAHSIWTHDDDVVICDTAAGALYEVRSGERIWSAGHPDLMTRGMAVGHGHLAVGRSLKSGRADRVVNDGGLWLVDTQTMETVESYVFPRSGGVNEVRLLDGFDECHNGIPAPVELLDDLVAAKAEFGAADKRPALASREPQRRDPVTDRLERGSARDRSPAGTTAEFAREAHALLQRVETMARGADVLVWVPILSPGGGVRLLMSLLPALTGAPGIRSVRLAIPKYAMAPTEIAELTDAGISVLTLSDDSRRFAGQAIYLQDGSLTYGIQGDSAWMDSAMDVVSMGCTVVYVPWPHRQECPNTSLPVVCTIQDTTLIDYPEGLGAAAAAAERASIQRWLERCEATVVSSQSTVNNLVRLYGDLGRTAEIIHHAILPRPEIGEDQMPAERRAELPKRYVICATNISPHKNVDLLLHAWSRLARRTEWPLLLIGHGTEVVQPGTAVEAMANWRHAQLSGVAVRLGLGPDSGLMSMGYVPDAWVGPLIGGAAALVMPSFTEGGGSFPVEEALSQGIPVLCSDIPVMREHMSHRSAGAGWFDPMSVDSMVAAVNDLIDNYDERRASARNGRLDMRPTWHDVATEYANVFTRVVASGHDGLELSAVHREEAPASGMLGL
jgi:glycosyltransferase involved in cell wall biosynthesis